MFRCFGSIAKSGCRFVLCFLLRLSSDLGGVWLFRIECEEAAILRLRRLGCVRFFVYVLGLSSSLRHVRIAGVGGMGGSP